MPSHFSRFSSPSGNPVHTAQTPTQTQITIEPIVVCIGVCVGVGQSERTIKLSFHFVRLQRLYPEQA